MFVGRVILLILFQVLLELTVAIFCPYTTLSRSLHSDHACAIGLQGEAQVVGVRWQQLLRQLRPLDEAVVAAVHVLGEADGLQLRSEEHTSELQSRENLVRRLLLEKKNYIKS